MISHLRVPIYLVVSRHHQKAIFKIVNFIEPSPFPKSVHGSICFTQNNFESLEATHILGGRDKPQSSIFFFANPLVALRVLLLKTILLMIHVIASAALVRATEHVVMSRVFCEET